MKKIFLTAIYFCFLASKASAVPSVPLHETWTSVRALGMGNAYSAIVDDADSLFYNPAGLNKVSGVNWTIIDPRGGVDDLNILQTLNKFKSSTDLPSLVQGEYGKHHWANAGAKTALAVPHFGLAVFGNGESLVSVSNPPYPEVDMQYYADYGGVVGIGFEPVPEFLKFGMDVKYIIRSGTESSFTGAQLASSNSTVISDALKNTGNGYALDTGLLLTIPGPIRPSLSFVWKNMGVTSFTQTAGTAPPPPIQDEMVLGGALEISVPLISITPAIDYKYANRTDLPFSKKISAGVEVSLPVLNFRGGFNQGYYTAGVGVDLLFLRIDAATYGEEIGEAAGQIEDRRYMVQATFEIGFDPFAFFGSGSGSKSGSSSTGSSNGGSYRRGLKQRR